jgi:hypothetical protein
MEPDKTSIEELTTEVKRLLEDNRKFLEHMMDDDFEAEDDLDEERSPDEEL